MNKLPTERTEEDGLREFLSVCEGECNHPYCWSQKDKPARAYELAMFLTRNGQQGNAPEMQREIEQFYADKGEGWIEIKEGCEMPEVEELVLIVTKEPEMRLATMGGHRDTFWEHLHDDEWDVRSVFKWKRI